MKNSILISALVISLFLSFEAYSSSDTHNFMQNLSICNAYVNNSDNKIQIILGWSTRKCYLKEINTREEIVCGFKELELKELIDNYNAGDVFDINESIRTFASIKKYLLKPETCRIKRNRTFY